MGDATKIGFGNCTNITYRELFGLSYLLGYDSERMGCCGMVLHPEFKYNGYPQLQMSFDIISRVYLIQFYLSIFPLFLLLKKVL